MKPLRCNHYRCKRKARASIHIIGWAFPLHYACVEHALPIIKAGFTGCKGATTVVVEWAQSIYNPAAPDGDPRALVTAAASSSSTAPFVKYGTPASEVAS